MAEKAYLLGTIKYPALDNEPEMDGHIIYIKSTLIKDLNLKLLGYKSINNDFPDETTADQFFDDEQFDAYRELGYTLCQHMLNSKENNIIPVINRFRGKEHEHQVCRKRTRAHGRRSGYGRGRICCECRIYRSA